MVGLSRVKERIETDLSDVELQAMIDEAQAEIDARFGAAIPDRNPNSVTLNGNNFLFGTSNPTGLSDGNKGIFSCWIRMDGKNSIESIIFSGGNNGDTPTIKRNSDNKFQILGRDSAGVLILDIETTNTFAQSLNWIHLLASWDLSVAVNGRLYITNISDAVINTLTVGDINYEKIGIGVGATAIGSFQLEGCLADLYFNNLEFLDFDIEANRRLFIDENGKPVNLGTDGRIPTGFSPFIYLTGPTETWNINNGSGNGLSVAVALTDCSTGPSGVIGAKDITVFIGDDQDLDGYRTFLDLIRPLAGTAVVTEIDHTTETLVAADDFRVINGGRTLQRLTDGTNPRQFWQRLVKVVYSPVADFIERDEVIILLVQLGIEYRGLKSEKTGDHASSFMDYAAERNSLMSRLSPRRGVLMA